MKALRLGGAVWYTKLWGDGNRWIPRAPWPDRLAYKVNSRLGSVKDSVLKKKKKVKENTLTYMYTCANALAHTGAYIHTKEIITLMFKTKTAIMGW